MPPAPVFHSAETACEMTAVYGYALLRDVAFADIEAGTSSYERIINDLLWDMNRDVNACHSYAIDGVVTRQSLIRGNSRAVQMGPVVSQMLLHDFNFGSLKIFQRINIDSDKPQSVHPVSWVDLQDGAFSGVPRIVAPPQRACNYRSLGSYVHSDQGAGEPTCQAFINAAVILTQYGAPLASNIPRLLNEEGDVTFAQWDIIGAIGEACESALTAAWRNKWVVNLRLRPEAYAGRVHFTLTEMQRYGVHPFVLSSRTLRNVKEFNRRALGVDESYLLPQMFSEGSPTHPSYPAGHATYSGAAGTILKAFFDERTPLTSLSLGDGSPFKIYDSVTCNESEAELEAGAVYLPPHAVTVGSEIDKLVYNIANARTAAGVHFVSDNNQGILLGQEIASALLADRAVTYNENFFGFEFTGFDGRRVTIPVKNHKYPSPPGPVLRCGHQHEYE
eukprot:GHVN01042035.1.p1 GENE.GHVN01042035.1~~GHVN01042035.1.p1  ORF type:complete len:525 (+),score=62.80 GHVN01042035.1:236-1576(+)